MNNITPFINLKFVPGDFDNFRSFEKAVIKQLGNTAYVGTENVCLYFEYPKELKELLRPFPKFNQLEFKLVSERAELKK